MLSPCVAAPAASRSSSPSGAVRADGAARALRPDLQRGQRDDPASTPRSARICSSSSSLDRRGLHRPSRPGSRRLPRHRAACPPSRRGRGALGQRIGRASRCPRPDRDGRRHHLAPGRGPRRRVVARRRPPSTVFGLGLALMVAPLTATVLAAAPDDNAGSPAASTTPSPALGSLRRRGAPGGGRPRRAPDYATRRLRRVVRAALGLRGPAAPGRRGLVVHDSPPGPSTRR